MSLSALKQVKNPFRSYYSNNRLSYYTNISFDIDSEDITSTVKVDTGSAYTVIGLGAFRLKKFSEQIKQFCEVKDAFDASENKLDLHGYVVDNFRLTEDIVIPKIKIYFSDKLGEKAVLGIDVLGLFEFRYAKYNGSNKRIFEIYNYEEALKYLKLKGRVMNNNLEYIDPDFIAELSDTPVKTNTNFTMRDAEAAYVHKMINEHDNKRDT